MVKGSWKMNRGASLPIVLAILFSLLPLSMVLISLSDNGMQGVIVEHKRFQELYKAEASIYARLYALPIKNLFNVRIEENGFWDKACVNLFQGELCAVYGYGFESYHFLKNNLELQEAFQSRLSSLKNALFIRDTLYGNRYFERLPSECFAVENGDVNIVDYKLVDLILGEQKETLWGNDTNSCKYRTFSVNLQILLLPPSTTRAVSNEKIIPRSIFNCFF